MPYRRLPNTDSARIRTLHTARDKGGKELPFNLAFSQKILQEIKYFLPSFEQAIQIYKETYEHQIKENKIYNEHQKKAKIFISHFIQVINMAIARGEQASGIRKFYKLTQYENKVPHVNTEIDIIEWGNNIIHGEAERISKGASPITNPTAALVKVMFEKFQNAHNRQQILKVKSHKALESVGKLRNRADEIILLLWNEIENNFDNQPSDIKREKASEYGVVYVFRKNELPSFMNINSPAL